MGFTKTDIGLIAKHAGLWPAVIGASARRAVDGAARNQSRVVVVRRRTTACRYSALPGSPGSARRRLIGYRSASGARRGDRLRGARCRPRHGGIRCLHRARPRTRPTRQRNSRCSRALPPCRAPSSTPRPAGWSRTLAGCNFFLLCTVLAVPGMLLLSRVAPWTIRQPDWRSPRCLLTLTGNTKISAADRRGPRGNCRRSVDGARLRTRRCRTSTTRSPTLGHRTNSTCAATRPRRKKLIFVGMNPGPFGMVQCGVPFGEIAAVRDWMGHRGGQVDKPARENPQAADRRLCLYPLRSQRTALVGLVSATLRHGRGVLCRAFCRQLLPAGLF